MSDSFRVPPEGKEPRRLRLDALEKLPAGAPELSEPLPDWVTEAHLRWLATGDGDPWGGYFS